MPNSTKILRGATGQASLIQNIVNYVCGNGHIPESWVLSGGYPYPYAHGASNTQPNGWSVAADGTVTVPASAPLGHYEIYYTHNSKEINEDGYDGSHCADRKEFRIWVYECGVITQSGSVYTSIEVSRIEQNAPVPLSWQVLREGVIVGSNETPNGYDVISSNDSILNIKVPNTVQNGSYVAVLFGHVSTITGNVFRWEACFDVDIDCAGSLGAFLPPGLYTTPVPAPVEVHWGAMPDDDPNNDSGLYTFLWSTGETTRNIVRNYTTNGFKTETCTISKPSSNCSNTYSRTIEVGESSSSGGGGSSGAGSSGGNSGGASGGGGVFSSGGYSGSYSSGSNSSGGNSGASSGGFSSGGSSGAGSSGASSSNGTSGGVSSGNSGGTSGGTSNSSGGASGAVCIFKPATPLKPIFVVKDCDPASLTIGSPIWTQDAQHPINYIEIRRDGREATWQLFAANAVLTDLQVSSPFEYSYFARACNEAGCSDWSPALVVSMQSANAVEWLNPSAGQALAGRQTFVAKVTTPSGLAAQNGIRFLSQGQTLPGARQTHVGLGFVEWSIEIDTEAWEFQGSVPLDVQATDAGGCVTPPLRRIFNFNNTLQSASTWHDVDDATPDGTVATEVLVYAQLLQGAPPARQKWYEFGVICPPPVGYTMSQGGEYYGDQQAREEEWLKFQPLQLNKPLPLTGRPGPAGVPSTPSKNVLFRIRIRPKEYQTRYALNAAGVRSMRAVNDSTVEVLTHTPSLLYRVDKDGLHLKADLRDYGADGALSAVMDGDKIVCALPNRVVLIDLTPGDATLNTTIQAEPFTPARIERAGESQVLFFGSAAGHRIYRLTGNQAPRVHDSTEVLRLTRQRGNRIAVVSESVVGEESIWKIREMTSGAAPGPTVIEHDVAIRALFVGGMAGSNGQGTGYAFQFADNFGRLYEAGRTAPVANFDWVPLALGQFKGSAARVRRIAGGQDNRLWLEDEATGVYQARVTLEAGATIRHLERIVVTVVPGEGDALMGGSPSVDYDILLAAVQVPDEDAYLLRLQESNYTPGFSYGGTGVHPYGPIITKAKGS